MTSTSRSGTVARLVASAAAVGLLAACGGGTGGGWGGGGAGAPSGLPRVTWVAYSGPYGKEAA